MSLFSSALSNLKELSLDKNYLTDIPTPALQALPLLEDVSLGVNDIRTVPSGSLNLPALKSLSLEVNQIDYIPRDAFQMSANLLYLYISNNRLVSTQLMAEEKFPNSRHYLLQSTGG